MGSWFATPDVVSLKLSDGQTITVRRQLSAGDQRARFARMSIAATDGALSVNRLQIGLATITAYLVDWTITDATGTRVDIRGLATAELETILDSLLPARFAEIQRAIEDHEVGLEAEKKSDRITAIAS